MSSDEIDQVQSRLAEAGCCYISSLNTLLVQQFDLRYAAEEAARFVCSSGWGDVGLRPASPPGESAFYRSSLLHALCEYGSRVLCPGRPPLREFELYSFYSPDPGEPNPLADINHRDFMRLIDFIVLHRDFELNTNQYRVIPELIREGRNYADQRSGFATKWLGRILGSELYDAYLKGSIAKRSIRSLLLDPHQNPKTSYFRLAQKCRSRRWNPAA